MNILTVVKAILPDGAIEPIKALAPELLRLGELAHAYGDTPRLDEEDSQTPEELEAWSSDAAALLAQFVRVAHAMAHAAAQITQLGWTEEHYRDAVACTNAFEGDLLVVVGEHVLKSSKSAEKPNI
jgi:hypothetical protein